MYEGHDIRKEPDGPNPKSVDQPLSNPDGKPTDNGKFWAAAEAVRNGAFAARVHVYEKLHTAIWVFNGTFELVDAWQEEQEGRSVCKFKLRLLDEGQDQMQRPLEHSRVIPSAVKAEVWERDAGRCVLCGATENLHFDHEIPYSRGGTSLTAANIRILCAQHNIAKGDKIE